MPYIIADRVLETSTTTGTGAYSLAGAVIGNQAFSSVCNNGDTFEYFAEIVDAGGVPTGDWEVGLGTWNTGGTITRTKIYKSSIGSSAISWTAGTKRIAITITANSYDELKSVPHTFMLMGA